MKKIFTLLAAALVTLTSFADRRDGMMTITQIGRNDVVVEVDGRRFNDREIMIRNLEPGRHVVSIYTFDRHNGWKGIFGRETRKEYLFNTTMMVRPRQHIDIVINRFGKVVVDYNGADIDRYGKDDKWGRDRDRDHDRDRDYGRDRDDKYDKPRNNGYDNRNDNGYDNRNDNRYDNRYDNRTAMDMRSFDMLKDALRRENFENSRLAIAKQSVERNAFSAQQVKEMVNLFAFENNKLEFAKAAYANTIDKKNYFVIYDAFSFSRSKEELADFVRRY